MAGRAGGLLDPVPFFARENDHTFGTQNNLPLIKMLREPGRGLPPCPWDLAACVAACGGAEPTASWLAAQAP